MIVPYWLFGDKSIYLQNTSIIRQMELNRLKVVLVEKKRTGKWLAEKLGKNEATVSRWCTNEAQPSLETLFAIARVLNVEVKDLLVPIRE